METIPKDLFNEIIGHLDVSQLIELCSSNQRFNRFCNDINLWRILFQRDYHDLMPSMPSDGTINFKQEYIDLHRKNTRLIPIYVNETYTTDLWIDNFDNYKTIINRLRELLNSLDRNQIIIEIKSGDTILISGELAYVAFIRLQPHLPITSVYIYDTPEKYRLNQEKVFEIASRVTLNDCIP